MIPTRPGYYWAQWRKAAPGTRDGDELTPSNRWQPVQVFENALDDQDPEYLRVEVGGIEKAQSLDGFVWGAALVPLAVHPDDTAVDCFATAMKAKLAKKRAEGRGGWNDPAQCSVDFLSQLLREHVGKGDPVDVGNFAMMIHQRGTSIAPAPAMGPAAIKPDYFGGLVEKEARP